MDFNQDFKTQIQAKYRQKKNFFLLDFCNLLLKKHSKVSKHSHSYIFDFQVEIGSCKISQYTLSCVLSDFQTQHLVVM